MSTSKDYQEVMVCVIFQFPFSTCEWHCLGSSPPNANLKNDKWTMEDGI
jgi:hypothetical protein